MSRAPVTHFVKSESDVFIAVVNREKTFEFRKNDRDYQLGDFVHLQESKNEVCTGASELIGPIRYIVYGPRFGIPDGYCIFNW